MRNRDANPRRCSNHAEPASPAWCSRGLTELFAEQRRPARGAGTYRKEVRQVVGLRVAGRKKLNGVSYERPVAFWTGCLLVTAGVLLQLPMYYMARHNHYRLAGMPVTPQMSLGMAMMFVGVLLTIYGLFPRHGSGDRTNISRIRVAAIDDAPIKPAHVRLLLAIAVAITIDVMKPTAFAFLAPGAAAEYGLRSPLHPHVHALSIALYPLAGIGGTAVGSLIWGWLADRIGRRASIIAAAVIFIATSTCGTMPEYWMNLVTCFLMGISVGGMLPIAFTLMSETIPARHRGWLMVLIGGDVAGAYIITSWISSTWAAPDRFGWRMLWLIGLPTGLLLLLLSRWIPESPRFLLQRGQDEEAHAVMTRYGADVVQVKESELAVEKNLAAGFRQLFTGPFVGLSAAAILLALSIGMTQYGFQQWMPTNLQRLGFTAVNSSKILRDSALIGFPFLLPVALLYGFWSSKKTVILMAAITLSSLLGFMIIGDHVVHYHLLLRVLLVVPIWGISVLTSVLAAYTVEIYPTVVRARASGLSAGATKLGGVMILAVAATAALAIPSMQTTAVLGGVPMAVAIVVIAVYGPETKRKRLEQITAEELRPRIEAPTNSR
jgi:putative MFS transporter